MPKPKLKYEQLADHFRARINAGQLRAGEPLPSQQAMQSEFAASQSTMERAYALLEKEGLIERRWRSGVFVRPSCASPVTGNIGVLGSPGFQQGNSLYAAALMEGIIEAAGAASRHPLILGNSLDWDGSDCHKVDGFLIVNIENMQPLLEKIPASMPCVSLLNNTARIACVKADDEGGARQAVEYLVARGHRRIAFLKNNDASIPTARQQGYRAALRDTGIAPRKSWLCSTHLIGHVSPGQHRLAAYSQIERWLQSGWEATGCTALLAQNDHLALGAIRAFSENGLRVPEDVSVIGFDGTELCDYFPPRLTSVKIPLREIGRAAVGVLLKHLQNPAHPVGITILPATLHEGESVCAANIAEPISCEA